jgi:hypothetical protein
MITLDDIVDYCPLSREEVEALSEHEHVDGVAAAALADYLMHLHKGPQRVQEIICDDIREALHRDDLDHARQLFVALRHFISDHPEAVRGSAAG